MESQIVITIYYLESCRSKSQCEPPSLEKKRNRHSYIELLEEVTNELNLSAVKVDPEVSHDNTDKIIQDAFNFLDNDIDTSNVLNTIYKTDFKIFIFSLF